MERRECLLLNSKFARKCPCNNETVQQTNSYRTAWLIYPRHCTPISIKIGRHLLKLCIQVCWCVFLCPTEYFLATPVEERGTASWRCRQATGGWLRRSFHWTQLVRAPSARWASHMPQSDCVVGRCCLAWRRRTARVSVKLNVALSVLYTKLQLED